MMMIWIFKYFILFSIEDINGLGFVFTFMHLKNIFSKLIFLNGNLLSNKASKSMFIELLVYFYTMIQLSINCILMGLIIYCYV